MDESAYTDRLLHITDVHFWEVVLNPLRLLNKRALGNLNVVLRRRFEYDVGRAEAFAEVLAGLEVPTVFAGGDFTSTATDTECRRALEFVRSLVGRGLNVLALPGNHDYYTFEAVRKRRFERHFEAFLPEEGFPARLTLPGGTPFVLVPTVCANWFSSSGRITPQQVEESARLIAECPPGPVLAGAHYPVLHRTHAYDSSRERRLRNARLLRTALGESGRDILYLSGHVHRFSYVQDPTYPKLRHLTTSALFMHRRGTAHEGAFSEIRVSDAGFEVHQHWREQHWKSEAREAVACELP